MLFFQYRSYMLEIKFPLGSMMPCVDNTVTAYSFSTTFEKKEDREKEKQKQKLYVMDVLSELSA